MRWYCFVAICLTACGSNNDSETVTVTVTSSGDGSGTIAASDLAIDCGDVCVATLPRNSTLRLTATADEPSSEFAGWTGGGCDGTGACELVLSDDITVDAAFVTALRRLSVVPSGNGIGNVTSTPAGIDCGSDCDEQLPRGTSVQLAATAEAGSSFTGWGGGGCSGTGACEVTVSAATTVMATFTLNQYDLTVVHAGTGTGTVTSSPAGISCGADCVQTFAHGQSVVLTATADPGSNFVGWSGEGCSGTGTCTVTMAAAATVTAAFAEQDSLTVTKIGTGEGRVTSTPVGIDCGADCTQAYPANTVVTLTATPIGDATFTGWSGACTGIGACSVTIDAAKLVTASFTQQRYTLTIMKAGTGMGPVTSAPAGIACGTDCTEDYDSGTTVTLTASPVAGDTFDGWSGACTGTGTCTVTMTAATTVTATYTRTYLLSVARAGTGTGTVTSTPAGINCGTDCSERYSTGQMVVLSAVPDPGSDFSGWSGACTGTASCTVTMTAAKNVTASFGRRGLYYTIHDASDDTLQYISPTTSTAVDVGALGIPYSTGDCAWNPANNRFYAITNESLYRIDVATNTPTFVGLTGSMYTNALVFYKGSLYGIASGSLYRINIATGAGTPIGSLGLGTVNFVGAAWDTTRDRVIGYLSGSVQFYEIDMTTGAATLVGSPAGMVDIQGGITYDPIIDRFVAVTGDGELHRYNPVTFTRTTVAMGLGTHNCIAFRP